MNIENRDLRVKLTHKMIIDAFLQLRKEKPLRKITVRELCDRAGVGRGTFYAHFMDVYDLNEQLENDFLASFTEAIKTAFEKTDVLHSTREICRTVFALLEKNEDVCNLILSSDNTGGVMKFIELGKRLCMEYYAKYFRESTPEKVAQFYRFVSSGCISCLQGRLASRQRVPVEQFADEMAEIIMKGARYLA